MSSYANCEDRSISSTESTGFPGQQVQTDIDFNCYDSAENGGTYEPVSYTHSEYNWMYGLSAGFAYQITPNAQIDVGYHYVNAPDIDYYTVGANGVERNEGIDFHQVKVGLRYALW
jgi:opacity protein-like surface antigen